MNKQKEEAGSVKSLSATKRSNLRPWVPAPPPGDSGLVYCPRKRGVIAQGRCLKWQKQFLCAYGCKNAVTDKRVAWKENPAKYFLEPQDRPERRGRGNYNRWEQLKAIIVLNGGSTSANEILSQLDLASYEAAAMMLRYYEKKGLLAHIEKPRARPQRYELTAEAKKELPRPLTGVSKDDTQAA